MLPKDTPDGGGLYIIWLSDTHYYGGRAKRFKTRWRAHLRDLRAGQHENSRMQAVYDKYGRFEPKVLVALMDGEEAAEQQWLDENFRKPGCVNLSPLAKGGCDGRSEETRKKMSATRTSRPDLVEKARETLNRNRIQKGGSKSEDAKRKVALGMLGKTQTLEHVEKRAAAHRGRKNTPETLARMSESAKKRAQAQPPAHGPETRTLISEQQKGRVWINDGSQNRRVFPDVVPEGWAAGRLPLASRPR